MNRRQALHNVAWILGGTIAGSALFLQSGCKPATPEVAALFTPEWQTLLGDIAETILPATETPGAREAGVGNFIPVMVRDCYTPEEQKILLDGIVQLQKDASDMFGKKFEQLDAAQRTTLLQKIDTVQKEYTTQKKENDPPHYFRLLKETTLLGFFTSETGATKALRYVAVPGRYEGCIPYQKGDRAWAT